MAIHPTAIIDRKAELDRSVEVGPYCVIEGHVQVNAGCSLSHGVYLTGWTHIGENCVIHPGVVVGHEPQDIKYGGERSYCRVGSGTILREYVTIHRGSEPESETNVGSDCFLLAGSHVGHNCVVGDRVTLVNHVLLAGHVEIGAGVTIGGGVGVHQFVRIGELAMVAGGVRATKDVLPFALTDWAGNVAGLNRIGIRRSNLSPEEVTEVRAAYRVLFGRGLRFHEAVQRLAGEVQTPAGRRLLAFLQTDSKRGIAGRARKRKKNPDTANEWE